MQDTRDEEAGDGPGPRGGLLRGVKVVEFAQVIAGPLAGTLMADFGADVVHVEAPGTGDSARTMGPARDGHHLWWKVLGRNKRSVTLDMHQEPSVEVVRRLVAWADVVIVTFRAATLARFGLDWESVSAVNPSAVLLQISGYGATSSRRDSPGFGKMGEARSGLVHLTGLPDGPPIHAGSSLGDSSAGLMGAFAVCAALTRRAGDPERRGEWIDLALFEPLFRLVEWQVIVRDQLGYVPQRSGNALAVAPAAVIGTFASADGDWITVTSATPRSVWNILRLLGLDRDDLRTAEAQVAARGEIDAALAEWITGRTSAEALEALHGEGVVASKVFDVDDILDDVTYRERANVVTVDDPDLGPIRMQAALPHVHTDPGGVWRPGAALGADNDLVYRGWLGIDDGAVDDLADSGTI